MSSSSPSISVLASAMSRAMKEPFFSKSHTMKRPRPAPLSLPPLSPLPLFAVNFSGVSPSASASAVRVPISAPSPSPLVSNRFLAPPTPFVDPRSPKPFRAHPTHMLTRIQVPAVAPDASSSLLEPPTSFLDPRSPKPFLADPTNRLARTPIPAPAPIISSSFLAPPLPLLDPRSPKPFRGDPIESMSGIQQQLDHDLGRCCVTQRQQSCPGSLHLEPPSVDTCHSITGISSLPVPVFVSQPSPSPSTSPTLARSEFNSSGSSTRSVSVSPQSRLSNSFWDAVTLQLSSSDSEPLMTNTRVTFADSDGHLWSGRHSSGSDSDYSNSTPPWVPPVPLIEVVPPPRAWLKPE